eukprot:SAG11_NODE_14664_length_604_cov_0.641584_2_plen_30_part_01
MRAAAGVLLSAAAACASYAGTSQRTAAESE